MDTKQMFIKTQLNLINWALALSSVFCLLSLYTFFGSGHALTSLFPALANTSIFASMLWVRLKLQVRAAKLLLASFSALFVYYLITFFKGLPALISTLKASAQMTSPLLIICSVLVGYGLYFLCGFLYYKVYKATCLINQLKQQTSSED